MGKIGREKKASRDREQQRIDAARRVVDDGLPAELVARVFDVSRSAVFDWAKRYREDGVDALAQKPVSGRPRKLTDAQERLVMEVVLGNDPNQLMFEFALWTRDLVKEFIWYRFGVDISAKTAGRMMRRWGLSPQRPLRRAYEQDPGAVERWRQVEYPRIRALAAEHRADIYFADESAVRSDYHSGTTWALVGQTPVVEATGKVFKVNMISAIAPDGSFKFDVFEGSMNSERFIGFCDKLILGRSRPVFLIVDNVSSHKSKAVQAHLKKPRVKAKLRIFYLPTYSPELNPDEWVWKHVKHDHIGKLGTNVIRNATNLHERVWSILSGLAKCPAFLRGFFLDPDLVYIRG